uniref:Sidoreflexin n=1 Tax=Panagrolaimus sp. JU765 TaxID=591449 RepID=A0AC34R7W4_9BILA
MADQLVSSLPISSRPNLFKPRWDQSTFTGRFKHFFTTANPINVFATSKQLENARSIVVSYKTHQEFPKDLTIEQLWRAKTLYDSAFHPETGEKMFILGRMSSQVPCNMSFNAIVNYTNRSGENAPTGNRLFVAYCCATGGALTSALGFNVLAKNLSPIVGRLVPFAAIAIANAINIPIMRSKEFTNGITIEDEKGNRIGSSKKVAYFAIPMVVISRITMAVPFMCLSPIIMEQIVKKQWYQKRPWIAAPMQTFFAGLMLTFMTPAGCALFPQKSKISIDKLEDELKEKIKKLPNSPKYVYYNKGL